MMVLALTHDTRRSLAHFSLRRWSQAEGATHSDWLNGIVAGRKGKTRGGGWDSGVGRGRPRFKDQSDGWDGERPRQWAQSALRPLQAHDGLVASL